MRVEKVMMVFLNLKEFFTFALSDDMHRITACHTNPRLVGIRAGGTEIIDLKRIATIRIFFVIFDQTRKISSPTLTWSKSSDSLTTNNEKVLCE